MCSAPAARVITKAPLLLIDLETEEGVTGRSYLWCYMPGVMPAIAAMLAVVEETVKGEPRRAARSVGQARAALRADRRAGHRAHGDGRSRRRGLGCGWRSPPACRWRRWSAAEPEPVARLQQLRARPDGVAEQVADEAEKLLAGGFRAVKLRLGYPTLQEDLAAVHAVRRRASATASR